MERFSPPPDEPQKKLELGLDRPDIADFEAILARRQQIKSGHKQPDDAEASLFDMMLEQLPETDPDLAVAVYEAMAMRGSEELQQVIACRIDLLYPVDRETATRIWLHLLRSENRGTSDCASDSIDEGVELGRLSFQEAAQFDDAYDEAVQRRELKKPFTPPEEP